MALIVAGFDTWVYSRSPAPNDKADLAEAVGARYISSETHSADELREEVGNIDLVYEAVGASEVGFDVLSVLGTNGVFVFTGVPGRKAPFEAAIRHLTEHNRRWPDVLGSLVTHYPMEAYEELLTGRAGGIKQVIDIAAPAS